MASVIAGTKEERRAQERMLAQKLTDDCRARFTADCDPYQTAIDLLRPFFSAGDFERLAFKIVFHAVFMRRAPSLMADTMQHLNNLHYVLEEREWVDAKSILAAVGALDANNKEL